MRYDWRPEESDAQIVIGVVVASFYFHQAASLKEKRGLVARLKARLRQKHEVSVAEVGKQDDPRQGVLAAAAVGSDSPTVNALLQSIKRELEGASAGELVNCTTELLHY
jgi:uncharacterized protein